MRFLLLLALVILGPFAIGQCNLSLTSSPVDCNSFAFHIQGADVGNVSWNFGDGSVGTSNVNSDHNYASNGTYVVTATYSGPACPSGITLTTLVEVACAVEPICPTQISASAIDCDSYVFTIAGSADGQVDWDFGDNTQLFGGVTAEHTFTGNGLFVVTANYFGPTCQAGTQLIATVQINCASDPVCPTEILMQSTATCQMPLFLLNTPVQEGESVVWYPGDGTGAVSGGHGFEHLYASAGTYEVCASYTSSLCPNGTEICTSVVVEGCPSPACPESLIAEAIDCNTSVFHITGIDGAQVNWNFGDGTLLTGSTAAEHSYASNGIYVVYAVVIAPNCPQANPNGVLTFVYTVQVDCPAQNDCPTSLWSGASATCQTMQFEIGSATAGENVTWYPGDDSGPITGGHFLEHAYVNPGNYSVCAYYTSASCPNGVELCSEITVAPCETSTCPTAMVAEAIDCDTYVFHIQGMDSATVLWSYDQSAFVSGGVSAEHTFDSNGAHVITASVLAPGCPGENVDHFILFNSTVLVNCIIEECPSVMNYNTVSAACQTMHFEIGSATPGENVTWYPGDETGAVQGTHNFTHAYANPGTYHVCAFYHSDACPSGIELCIDIVVEPCTQPSCPSEVTAVIGASCQTATFVLNGEAVPDESITWYPGDGTGPIAGGHLLEHSYANPGTYSVCCVVSSPSCPSQGELCTTLIVEACNATGCPTEITSEIANCEAFFHINGIDNADVIWEFGDGTTEVSGINATHVYAANGVYVVSATINGTDCPVMNPTGTVSLVYTIEINCILETNCPTEIISTVGANCGNYLFELNPNNADASITWYPGDESGAVQNTGAFEHSYAAPGAYHVCAWITSSACPNGAEICTDIVVDPCETPCNEGVLAIDSYILEGGTNALVYSLYSDNGFQLGGQATYTENDPYFDLPVCLPDGCYHLTLDNNNPLLIGQGVQLSLVINSVNVLENAEIIYQDNVSVTYLFGVNTDCSIPVCEALFNVIYTATPGHLEFENTSIYGGSATFSWSYGDGQTSDGFGGNVQYASNGLYEVCLTITTPACTNTHCIPVLIDQMPAGCEQNNIVVTMSANQLPDVTDVVGLSLLFGGQVVEAWSLLVQSGFSATYELCVPDGCYEIGCSSVMPLAAEAFNVTIASDGSTIGNLQLTMGGSEAMAVFGVNMDCTIQVAEQDNTKWSVYPNPAEDQINLVFDALNHQKSISLVDAAGRTLGSWNTSQNQLTLNVHEYAAGLYLLRVEEAGKISTRSLVIR